MRASGFRRARLIPTRTVLSGGSVGIYQGETVCEVTPKSMRMRKVILDETERKHANGTDFYFLVVIYKKGVLRCKGGALASLTTRGF